MDNLIDRVAEALYRNDGGMNDAEFRSVFGKERRLWKTDAPWDSQADVELCEHERDDWRAMAEAALDAAGVDALRAAAAELLGALPRCEQSGCSEAATHKFYDGRDAGEDQFRCREHQNVNYRGIDHDDEVGELRTTAPAARLRALLSDAPEKGGDRG